VQHSANKNVFIAHHGLLFLYHPVCMCYETSTLKQLPVIVSFIVILPVLSAVLGPYSDELGMGHNYYELESDMVK